MRWLWISAGVIIVLAAGARISLDVQKLIHPPSAEVDELSGLSGFVEATEPSGEVTPSTDNPTLAPPPLSVEVNSYVALAEQEEQAISPNADEVQTFFAPVVPTSAVPTTQAPNTGKRPLLLLPSEPLELEIPAIALKAPVIPMKPRLLVGDKRSLELWKAPDEFAAGWMLGTARLGEGGNTVLNGHHNIDGEVFRHLVDLQPGDTIKVTAAEFAVRFEVTNIMILEEKNKPLAVRLENARWLMPSQDERLTLVTCWPYDNNTHRLIVVARPIEYLQLSRAEPEVEP